MQRIQNVKKLNFIFLKDSKWRLRENLNVYKNHLTYPCVLGEDVSCSGVMLHLQSPTYPCVLGEEVSWSGVMLHLLTGPEPQAHDKSPFHLTNVHLKMFFISFYNEKSKIIEELILAFSWKFCKFYRAIDLIVQIHFWC